MAMGFSLSFHSLTPGHVELEVLAVLSAPQPPDLELVAREGPCRDKERQQSQKRLGWRPLGLYRIPANHVAREESRSDLKRTTRAARSKGARASNRGKRARGHHTV